MPLPLFPLLFQLASILERDRNFIVALRFPELRLDSFSLCLKLLDVSFEVGDSGFGLKARQSRSNSFLIRFDGGKLILCLLDLFVECCYGLGGGILC